MNIRRNLFHSSLKKASVRRCGSVVIKYLMQDVIVWQGAKIN